MLGKKIKKLRKEKGWTLDVLTKKSKVNKTTIWLLENKKQESANIKTISKLAKALDVELKDLI